ncbi:hypothetical protein BOX15_Mlig018479g4 [Macrostomum lignano]|uniref:Rad21/Rec8-like protein C-terminal eukaryotic domain-containing protein n=3 Tax=Macrostomum lignano TaxID=282301 RepID=A0A267FTU6_9PLAT|nr:hypothetical protein BOX15_Mlig018479g4 [Macrostomum lignano]
MELMRLSLPEDLEFSELRRGGGGNRAGRAESSSFARFTARQEDITILDTSFALEPSASQSILIGADSAAGSGAVSGISPSKDFGGRTSAEIHTTLTPRVSRQRRRDGAGGEQQPPEEELPSLPEADIPPLDLSAMFDRLKAGERLLFPAGDFERLLCEQQQQQEQQEQQQQQRDEEEMLQQREQQPELEQLPERVTRRGKRKAEEDLPAMEEQQQQQPEPAAGDQPQVELPATPPATTAATSTAMEVELPRDVTAELPQAAGLPGGVSIVSAADRQSPPPMQPPADQQPPRTSPPPPPPPPPAFPVLQFEMQPLQPRRQQQQQQQPQPHQPRHAKPRLLIVDGLTEYNSRRLRWNMDHGDELMKPLTLPPPTKGPRALALSTVDAAGLLLRPSRQPMSDKLLRVWEHKREESAHYVPPELLDYELPRLSAGGRPSARLSGLNMSTISMQSGQNLPRISEERVQVPTVIQSEAVPPEAEQPQQQPPEPEPQQQQQPEPPMMTPPAQQPAPPAFEDFFLQPPPPPEEVFASFVAERPPLSQDQELLMEGIRRSQQQQADSGSEIGDDYRPFASLCPPNGATKKEAARAFAGLLELAKQRRVHLRQKQPYSEIFVKAIED